jgi:SAM-dependent methyltransferase
MEALAALAVVLGDRAGGTPPAPDVEPHVRTVIGALGLDAALREVDVETARGLRALVRTTLGQALDFVDHPERSDGWTHDDPALLQATGALSAGFAGAIRTSVVPDLPGLAERIDARDAAFLDVGVGVGALAIAMTHVFPALHVTGIDIWEPALALARQNVEAAQLTDRIAIRAQDVCELADADTYDLIWFAGPFLPAAIVPVALDRCTHALRPGGWLMFARFGGVGPLSDALADLRTVRAGGEAWGDHQVLELLGEAGLRDGRHVPLEPGIPGRITAARR